MAKTNEPIYFILHHVALYAKLHYERSENIWEDIKACLRADDFEPRTKGDVLDIIVRRVAKLHETKDIEHYTLRLIDDISPSGCWRRGYYTNDYPFKMKGDILPEYDYYEAVLRTHLSILMGMTIDQLGGKLPKADGNVLPLRKQESLKKKKHATKA